LETAKPKSKHTHSLYIDKKWYSCKIVPSKIPKDPVKSLDVQLLNDLVLDPILGIKDVRTDKRIDFVGGIRGLKELERRCQQDSICAFAMNPV
jgi:uncharacterized protein (DUF1015 family)